MDWYMLFKYLIAGSDIVLAAAYVAVFIGKGHPSAVVRFGFLLITSLFTCSAFLILDLQN